MSCLCICRRCLFGFPAPSRNYIERAATDIVKKVYNWGMSNKLSFNMAKTKGIVFSSPGASDLYRRVPCIRFRNESIKVVSHLTFLGVVIDHKLSWKQHIKHITSRSNLTFNGLLRVARCNWGLGFEATNAIYDCLFLPTISYASAVWSAAASQSHNHRLLRSAQRIALLRLTRCYSTVSNAALPVVAGKLPILQFLQFNSKRFCISRGRDVDINGTIFNATMFELDRPVSTLPHPALKKGLSPRVTSTEIEAFTDGSKSTDGTASAFVIFQAGEEVYNDSFALHPECSVFQAEIFAVLMAINWCNTNFVNKLINIFTDSAATVAVLGNKDNTHPVANDIFAAASTSFNKYAINWIKGHSGIPGNERADFLARNVTPNPDTPPAYNLIPKSRLKYLIWDNALETWQLDWDKIPEQHITRRFIPKVKERTHSKWIQPTHDLVQFLTEHGRFRAYLKRFHHSNSDCCHDCFLKRNPYIEVKDKVCFSITPIVTCEKGCEPKGSIRINAHFHCLNAADKSTNQLKIESKYRILEELSKKSKDYSEEIQYPESCIPSEH
ncbi:uncharacterized protein [Centruroides vittatus]|uniref:uncharacterized protein n=1 Tax=Centruroides vittatus TaxID=120091 RepID=UPI00351002AD